MPYYIYKLIDPRTDEVRYVGITINAKRRFYEHSRCNEIYSPKRVEWIKDLRLANLEPVMQIIETVEQLKEAGAREKYWILYFQEQGCSLLNIRAGGIAAIEQRNRDRAIKRTLFGKFLYELIEYLDTDLPKLAYYANMNPSTLSRNTRGERIPERNTVLQLSQMMQKMANEKGISWPNEQITETLLHTAGYITESEMQKAFASRILVLGANQDSLL